MREKTAFIFPGQGSQCVGMGKGLWDASEDVRRLYKSASLAAGMDIAGVSFEGPASELEKDVTAQLAVYVCNEAYRLAALGLGIVPDAVTGYSLGFYSALVASGSMDFHHGIHAVKAAGEAAVEQSSVTPGTMGAVIGVGLDELEGICADASAHGNVWVSNVNAARQILVSGSVEGVDRAVELASAGGALSAYRLNMGAAYHSPLMEGASRRFSGHVAGMTFRPPVLPLLSYLDATYMRGHEDISATVATQISRRVQWRDTVQRLVEDGVTSFIEAGPGSALTRMVRWVDRSVKAVPMDTVIQDGVSIL